MQKDYLTKLLEIQGLRVERVTQSFQKGHRSVVIHLERTKSGYKCGNCGQAVEQGYDSSWQEARHLMLWHFICFLRFKR